MKFGSCCQVGSNYLCLISHSLWPYLFSGPQTASAPALRSLAMRLPCTCNEGVSETVRLVTAAVSLCVCESARCSQRCNRKRRVSNGSLVRLRRACVLRRRVQRNTSRSNYYATDSNNNNSDVAGGIHTISSN